MSDESAAEPNEVPFPRVPIENWAGFQKEIERYLDTTWLFRGVSSAKHLLVPSVGRQRDGIDWNRQREDALLAQFKREALPFLAARPASDWEWMALPQHHTVPTRLLDWSESPYVSLFFAAWGNDEEDAGLYVAPRPMEIPDLGLDPFRVESPSFFYPGYVTARLVSQRGVFTIHPNPAEIYNPPKVRQLVIKRQVKYEFRYKLDAMGLHHSSIYADLDGLARRLVNLQNFRSRPHLPSVPDRPEQKLTESPTRSKIDPRDPQKGQWGRESRRNGYELTANVHKIETDWYRIVLSVRAEPGPRKMLDGEVTFHLHDTFRRPKVTKVAVGGVATITRTAYGAFTVGAVTPDGTELELDLASLEARRSASAVSNSAAVSTATFVRLQTAVKDKELRRDYR